MICFDWMVTARWFNTSSGGISSRHNSASLYGGRAVSSGPSVVFVCVGHLESVSVHLIKKERGRQTAFATHILYTTIATTSIITSISLSFSYGWALFTLDVLCTVWAVNDQWILYGKKGNENQRDDEIRNLKSATRHTEKKTEREKRRRKSWIEEKQKIVSKK